MSNTRGVDLDDSIEEVRKTAATASAIAKITHAEASEARKYAREATKEVRARAVAFDKRLTAKCTCSTQLSQRARLLTAIKQDHHLNAINSPRQTANHLLTPSAHQPTNVNAPFQC